MVRQFRLSTVRNCDTLFMLDGGRWRYETTADVASGKEVRVIAQAKDRPGNAAELQVGVVTVSTR